MGNTIQTFTHERFGQVRSFAADDQTWFIAADTCQALELTNPSVAVSRLDEDEKAKFNLGFCGGATWCVNEPGLYALIMASRKPEAKGFKRWVIHEVLPSIRRHGVYAVDELLASDEFLEQALTHLRAERVKRLSVEQALLEARPKVSYYDLVLQSDSLLTTTEIAKDYGLSAKKLNKILRDNQVQFHQSGRWFLYAKFAEQGYTQSKTHHYDAGKTRTHMYWTQKGRLFIYDLLKNKCGLLPVIERDTCEGWGK